jgi:hypothetical protein
MENQIAQASVIKFNKKGKILIYSVSRTDFVSIATEPFIWLDITIPKEELAKQIIRALDSSKSGLKSPKDWKKHLAIFLKNLGLSNEDELYDDSISVGVLRKKGSIIFTPMKNMGKKKGTVNVPNVEFEIGADKNIVDIADAFQKALDKSE